MNTERTPETSSDGTRVAVARDRRIELDVLLELKLGTSIGQMRSVPVDLGVGAPQAFLLVYAADFDIDPYVEMFFFPSDTLKLALVTADGDVLWRRDLGRGVVPGVWFCPVFSFDLDGDGIDEIWFVNNENEEHPLGVSWYRLERLDAQNGTTTGQWAWPNLGPKQSLSHTFRNFITGGQVGAEPVLVTAQGTYGDMFLQGWRPDMTPRWKTMIGAEESGARGSHMCAITDVTGSGRQQLLWGERAIELDTGTERFCSDRDHYRGHSDVAQPFLHPRNGEVMLYTCRENDPDATPRVVVYDASGNRTWGAVDHGHIDLGWVAKMGQGGMPIATAVRVTTKSAGPSGRYHTGLDEFAFDAITGEEVAVPFSHYGTIPVDLDGDGMHELVRGRASRNGEVIDRDGSVIAALGAATSMACKFLDQPGEQLLAYYSDGSVRIWGDRNAEDSLAALSRYANPLYRANTRNFAVGYNLNSIAGI